MKITRVLKRSEASTRFGTIQYRAVRPGALDGRGDSAQVWDWFKGLLGLILLPCEALALPVLLVLQPEIWVTSLLIAGALISNKLLYGRWFGLSSASRGGYMSNDSL